MTKDKTNEDIRDTYFEKIARDYVWKMKTINDTLYFVMNTLLRKHNKIYNNFEENFGNIKDLNVDKLNILEHRKLYKAINMLDQSSIAVDVFKKWILMNYVSEFDALLCYIFKWIFLHNPNLVDQDNNKSLSFNELLKMWSVDNARELVIEKKIYELTKSSKKDTITWIQNILETESLTKSIKNYKSFIEIVELRNCVAHNDWKISKQTIDVLSKEKIKHTYKIGDNIKLEKKILDNCFEVFLETWLKLLYQVRNKLTKKLDKKNIEALWDSLNNICYELIEDEKNNQAIDILGRWLNNLSKIEEPQSLYLIINKWLALKLIKKNDEAKSLINNINRKWKDCLFRIWAAIILDDLESALKLVKQYGKWEDENQTKSMYQTQIIFKDLVKQKKFLELYKNIFWEKFKIQDNYLKDKTKNIKKKIQ